MKPAVEVGGGGMCEIFELCASISSSWVYSRHTTHDSPHQTTARFFPRAIREQPINGCLSCFFSVPHQTHPHTLLLCCTLGKAVHAPGAAAKLLCTWRRKPPATSTPGGPQGRSLFRSATAATTAPNPQSTKRTKYGERREDGYKESMSGSHFSSPTTRGRSKRTKT